MQTAIGEVSRRLTEITKKARANRQIIDLQRTVPQLGQDANTP